MGVGEIRKESKYCVRGTEPREAPTFIGTVNMVDVNDRAHGRER